MSDSDTSGFEDLAGIYKALGNETRLQLLFQIETGDPISELADGISRSGLQKHVESLIDADLVYRPNDSSQTYKLTALGELFLEKVREEETSVDEVLTQYRNQYRELREEEQETLDRMEDAGVDTKELEDKLRAEAWESIDWNSSTQIDSGPEMLGPTSQLQADENRESIVLDDDASADDSEDTDE